MTKRDAVTQKCNFHTASPFFRALIFPNEIFEYYTIESGKATAVRDNKNAVFSEILNFQSKWGYGQILGPVKPSI